MRWLMKFLSHDSHSSCQPPVQSSASRVTVDVVAAETVFRLEHDLWRPQLLTWASNRFCDAYTSPHVPQRYAAVSNEACNTYVSPVSVDIDFVANLRA